MKMTGVRVTPQARLLEMIGAASPGHNEAMQVMVLCLSQLRGSSALSELASEITGWCRRALSGKRVEIVELARDFIVIVSKEHDYSFLGIVNDTKVRLLRLIHRLMPEMFGTMSQSRLLQVFELPRDRRQVVQLVREQAAQASAESAAPGAGRILTYEQIAEVEAMHQRLGANRFADLFIRNQRIALIAHDRPPQPVMTEIFVSTEALTKHLLAGIDLHKDENLFNRLTLTLDRLVLRTVRQLQIPLHNSSLNLNIETVFSGEFESLDNTLHHNLQNLTIEFRAADIVQNYDQFIVARELIASRGGTVAVDAIVPPMVGVLAACELGARIAKVFWRPGAATDLRDRQAEIQKWHKGGTMVVLARLDDEEAVDVGRQLGVGLFQGFHIDKLLRANPVRESFRVA